MSRYTRGIELILVGSVLAISGLQVARAQSFVGKYGPAKSPEFMPYRQSLQRIQFLEREAAFLSQIIRLPQQVVLSTGECGSENAFYHPKHKAIVLCLELFAQIAKGIQRDFAHKASSEEIRSAVAGAYLFILMHEVGHALIHLLNLPVLGREEDAADQIGAFFLLQASKDPYLLTGALWFFRSKTLIYTRRHFSDEHSLGPQRQSNLACWALGKDPHQYQYLLRSGYLTRERAARCHAEYSRLNFSVRKLLGSNVLFAR